MNGRSLEDVRDDMEAFLRAVREIKSAAPGRYDAQLKLTKWREDAVEDFANNLLGDLGKFRKYVAELGVTRTPEIAKENLVTIAARVKQDVVLFEKGFGQQYSELCQRLKTGLDEVKAIVERYTPPGHRPGLK